MLRKFFRKNKSQITDGLKAAEITRIQSSDWEFSIENKSIKKQIIVTTTHGKKTWYLSFNKFDRSDTEFIYHFNLQTDVPTANDDVGNYYPAIMVVDGKPLFGVTLQLMAQNENTIFMSDDFTTFDNLASFCLSKLSGDFRILNNEEKVIASFPWGYDATFLELFPNISNK